MEGDPTIIKLEYRSNQCMDCEFLGAHQALAVRDPGHSGPPYLEYIRPLQPRYGEAALHQVGHPGLVLQLCQDTRGGSDHLDPHSQEDPARNPLHPPPDHTLELLRRDGSRHPVNPTTDLKPTAPLLVLAVANSSYMYLAPELQDLFSQPYRETHRVENPGENERREYFRPLVTSPPPKVLPPPPMESLPVLPAPESRNLTAREEKRLRKREDTFLRELRIFLRDIWTKESKSWFK